MFYNCPNFLEFTWFNYNNTKINLYLLVNGWKRLQKYTRCMAHNHSICGSTLTADFVACHPQSLSPRFLSLLSTVAIIIKAQKCPKHYIQNKIWQEEVLFFDINF